MAFNPLALKLHPSNLGLPTTVEIGEAVRLFEPDPKMFRLASLFPMKLISAQTLTWNELESILGMTKGYTVDSDVARVGHRSRTPRSAEPFFFRESGTLVESDFINAMSEMAYNKLACEELVMNFSAQLDLRCETRIEWCRAQALANGSITVGSRTVEYNIPGTHQVTAGTLWSDPSADVIGHIQAWIMLFRGVGTGIRCMYSRKVAQYLSRNEKLIDLFKQSGFAGDIGPAKVGKLLESVVGDGQPITFEIYDDGYLDEDTGVYYPFLPDNKFIMIANPPKGQPLGHFMSTPSISNAGENEYTPRAGKFVVVDNRLKQGKPEWEQTQGIYGGVALYHPKNVIQAQIAA